MFVWELGMEVAQDAHGGHSCVFREQICTVTHVFCPHIPSFLLAVLSN